MIWLCDLFLFSFTTAPTHPYYLLINTPAPRPEAGSGASNAEVLRACCAGAALVLRACCGGAARALFQNQPFAWEVSQKRWPRLAPGTSGSHLFKMRISPQRQRHFASKPPLFRRNLASLTRGESGDFAWEVCTFLIFMSFSRFHFQSFLIIYNMTC
jgi:hypothetical protein